MDSKRFRFRVYIALTWAITEGPIGEILDLSPFFLPVHRSAAWLRGKLAATRSTTETTGKVECPLFWLPQEWEAFMDDFQQTLNKFKVPAAEQAELRAIVQSTYGDIVVAKA
jgi:hypothetical protein